MKEETFKNDLNEIIQISKEYDAEKVFLFGSCLEGIESAKDIDIAVQGINPEKFFEMYGKILGATDNEIDLVPIENVREHFANSIFENGKLIYDYIN
ncbi:MAG: nucleotidyltransferase family protein [Candidatus Omnitrophota bacterium]